MSLQEDRIARGQCPNCGKEAAPYRLCWDCRQMASFRRVLRGGEKVGALLTMRDANDRRKKLYSLGPNKTDDWGIGHRMRLDEDRSRAPRLRGIAVDVEQTICNIILTIGRPVTEQELVEAWGRLRSKRTSPLAADLGRIIAADEKRARKLAKRATSRASAPTIKAA